MAEPPITADRPGRYRSAIKAFVLQGDEFTADIMEALRRYHSLLIGERTAEQIKIQVGAAMKDLDNPPDDIPGKWSRPVTGIPKQVAVSYQKWRRPR